MRGSVKCLSKPVCSEDGGVSMNGFDGKWLSYWGKNGGEMAGVD